MNQNTRLFDMVRVYNDVLPKQHCEKIIEHFEASKGDWDIQRTPIYKFDQVNINKTTGWEPVQEYLTQVSIDSFKRYFEDLEVKNPPTIKALEEIRIKRYLDSDMYFDYHVDVADYKSARRYLAGFIYLDSNEEGQTVFPELDIKIECVQGSMVIFPPLWMFPHAGLPPVKKPKYIIGTYAHYV